MELCLEQSRYTKALKSRYEESGLPLTLGGFESLVGFLLLYQGWQFF